MDEASKKDAGGVACEVCGAADAVQMGEHHLCVDCYAIQSSSCAGSREVDAGC